MYPNSLHRYRTKRKAGATPEPFGKEGKTGTRRFVVQKHAATRMHYDFRLEWNGVLLSWAVPKGPSFDPNEKRYAVQTEDHPVEYADFEGIIPVGNYGAGEVIVWDRGSWTPLEDFDEGLKKGKLLFELVGFKLRGVWTLVRIKKSPKDWLLIKHRDGFAGRPDPPETSILSGLTVEEMGQSAARVEPIRAAVAKLKAPKKRPKIEELSPMLAEVGKHAFSRDGWIFEIKYDGFRLLGAREAGGARFFYRRGMESTALFPDLKRAVDALPWPPLILDGEVTVHDPQGRPSFQRLQKRTQLTRSADIERAAIDYPAVWHVFDLLAFDDWDLRGLPLVERKKILSQLLPAVGPLRYADHVETAGEAMMEEARKLGLEGVVAKRAGSPYKSIRSPDWVKLRLERNGDFAVVGYAAPKGGRVGIGSLILAGRGPSGLIYAGRAGSGLTDKQLSSLREKLDETRVEKPPCDQPVTFRGDVWCTPTMVAEVKFREWTEEANLRQPVFVRFRDDKDISEIDFVDSREEAPPEPPPAITVEKKVPFTNLDKVFWPEEGYTKGDLCEYYRAIAPWILPYLADRPVVMTRFPDGIHGKSFFQKDAPGFAPAWLRTERMWSEQASREIDYFIVDCEEALVYLANLGTIPLHVWASRVQTLERPDWVILDLDPKGAPFTDVVKVALCIRRLCEEIELPAFCKTSGSTGLHVLMPLGRLCTYDECKTFGELLARAVADELPECATITRVIEKRGGRVYLDFLQNGHGKLLVAPFSARPVDGAKVSTPLEWREVNAKLDPSKLTIKTVPKRLAKQKTDPLREVLTLEPNLPKALERLASRFQ
jgi:bifunctional non-homologous end joining protein LigD